MDFVILDFYFDELILLRIKFDVFFDDVFFVFSILGDDCVVSEIWVNGCCCYNKKELIYVMV